MNHNSCLIQIWSVLLVHQSGVMRTINLVSVPHNSGFMTKWTHISSQRLKNSSVDTPEGRLQDHFGSITNCINWLKFTKFCSDNLIIEK